MYKGILRGDKKKTETKENASEVYKEQRRRNPKDLHMDEETRQLRNDQRNEHLKHSIAAQ